MKLKHPLVWVLLISIFALQPKLNAQAVPKPKAAVRQNHDSPSTKLKAAAAAQTFCFYNNGLNKEAANEYAKYVLEASARYKIDAGLITGIIIKESRAKVNARSKYAVGLMQVYWRLHKKTIMAQFPHIKTEKILMQPRNNIMVGTWLFSRYMVNCNGNTNKALQKYLGSKDNRYVNLVMKYRHYYSERLAQMQRPAKRSA